MKIGLVKLLSKKFDVCEEAYVLCHNLMFILFNDTDSRNAKATVQCPVEPGSYIVEHTVALPKEIPKGKLLRIFTKDIL